jgi:hypothetical protein
MSCLRGSIRINDRVGGGMCHSVWLYVRRCNHPTHPAFKNRLLVLADFIVFRLVGCGAQEIKAVCAETFYSALKRIEEERQ